MANKQERQRHSKFSTPHIQTHIFIIVIDKHTTHHFARRRHYSATKIVKGERKV